LKIYTEKEKPLSTASVSKSLSLSGERRNPIRIPLIEDTKYKSVQKALNHISNKMYQAEAVEQYNDALAARAKFQADIKRKANEEWRNLTIDEHMERYNTEYQSFEKDLLAKVSNKDARTKIQGRLGVDRYSIEADIRGIAYNRQVDRTISKANTQLDELTNVAIASTNDAEFFEARTQIEEIYAGLEATGAISSEQKVAGLEKITDKIAHDKLVRFIDENPSTAYTVLSEDKKGSGTVYDSMDEDDKTAIKDYAHRKYKAETRAKASKNYAAQYELKRKIEDDLASRMNNGFGHGDVENDIYTVYASQPERAEAMVAEYRDKARIAQNRNNIKSVIQTGSPEELKSFFDALKVETEGTEGASEAKANLDYAGKLLQARVKVLSESPSKYVRSYMPNATDNQLIAEQKRLGIPEHAISLIDKDAAEGVVAKLMSSSGKDIDAFLHNLTEKYGDNWNIAYKDLVTKGKLPVGLQLVFHIQNPILRAQVADAFKLDDKEINERLGTEANVIRKDIKERVENELEEWIGCISRSGISTTNDRLINNWKDALEKIAIRKVLQGIDPISAAEEAANIINSRYNFDNGYMVPVEYDVDDIAKRAQIVINRLRGFNSLEASRKLHPNPNKKSKDIHADDVAKFLPKAGKGLAPKKKSKKNVYHLHPYFQKQGTVSSIKRNSFWANNEDESGIILMHESGLPVLKDDGSRIEVKFNYADDRWLK
jgi:hypothetical protein